MPTPMREVPNYRARQVPAYRSPRRDAMVRLRRAVEQLGELVEWVPDAELAEIEEIAESIDVVAERCHKRYCYLTDRKED